MDEIGDLVRCNICFQRYSRGASRYVITNCGHVFCEHCLQKGRNEECGVCKSLCRTMLLSDETDPEIKMLFTNISVLCEKFSKQFTEVVEFQECHRRRLLVHYKRKIAKLENTIKELAQELQSCRLSASQSHSRLPTSNTSWSMNPKHSDRYSPSVSQVPSANRVELMDVTPTVPIKKYVSLAGPTRLSLISPPLNSFMGPYRSNSTGGSLRSCPGSSQSSFSFPLSQQKTVSPANYGSTWNLSSQRSPQILPQTPTPSQASSGRQPITLANILQRRL